MTYEVRLDFLQYRDCGSVELSMTQTDVSNTSSSLFHQVLSGSVEDDLRFSRFLAQNFNVMPSQMPADAGSERF